MVNKQGLWFLTLFSLILVLSVYYITMPSELLTTAKVNDKTEEKNKRERERRNQPNSRERGRRNLLNSREREGTY